MQAIRNNTPVVYASKNQNVFNKQSRQNNNQISFSARIFCLGEYKRAFSDWFIEEGKEITPLPTDNFFRFLRKYLENFKKGLMETNNFTKEKIKHLEQIRRRDFIDIRQSLLEKCESEDIGKQIYDKPEGMYSSLLDYNTR